MTALLNIEEVEETSRVEEELDIFGEGADAAVIPIRQSMHQQMWKPQIALSFSPDHKLVFEVLKREFTLDKSQDELLKAIYADLPSHKLIQMTAGMQRTATLGRRKTNIQGLAALGTS